MNEIPFCRILSSITIVMMKIWYYIRYYIMHTSTECICKKTNYNPQECKVLYSALSISALGSTELERTYPFIQTFFFKEKYEIQREDTGQFPGLGDSYDGLVAELQLKQTLALSWTFNSINSVTIHPYLEKKKN